MRIEQMGVYAFEEFVKTVISSENIAFGSINLFYMSSEWVISLAIIVSIIIVCALAFVTKKKQKRPLDSIQHFEKVPKTTGEEKMFSKVEPETPSAMKLEELKGIGTKTSEKLKAVNITTVSDLAKASANVLSQKTGISEKSLSKWIEQANVCKRTEH